MTWRMAAPEGTTCLAGQGRRQRRCCSSGSRRCRHRDQRSSSSRLGAATAPTSSWSGTRSWSSPATRCSTSASRPSRRQQPPLFTISLAPARRSSRSTACCPLRTAPSGSAGSPTSRLPRRSSRQTRPRPRSSSGSDSSTGSSTGRSPRGSSRARSAQRCARRLTRQRRPRPHATSERWGTRRQLRRRRRGSGSDRRRRRKPPC
mmetsp:Transcript_39927/g.118441  ORF Transcript_39927/g.118441 Transcript_39927/m.118441 type:complete len:204 (+) Transcript_39927:332-943(+)